MGAGKRVAGAGRRARDPGRAQMAAAAAAVAVGSGLGRRRAASVLVSCFCKASLDYGETRQVRRVHARGAHPPGLRRLPEESSLQLQTGIHHPTRLPAAIPTPDTCLSAPRGDDLGWRTGRDTVSGEPGHLPGNSQGQQTPLLAHPVPELLCPQAADTLRTFTASAACFCSLLCRLGGLGGLGGFPARRSLCLRLLMC